MSFPNSKTGFTVRERGRASYAGLWLAGRQLAGTIGFAVAPGASANIALVSIQMEDKNGNPVPGIQTLDIWLSDAASGIGLTAVTASGTVGVGASGTILGALTASKALRVLTDANGLCILSITDTANTDFYVAASLPANGSVFVSRKLRTGDYYTPAEIAAATTSQLAAFTTTQIVEFTTAEIAALTTTQVKSLSTNDIAALTTNEVAAFTTSQLAVLTTSQYAALTTNDIAALSATQLTALGTGH